MHIYAEYAKYQHVSILHINLGDVCETYLYLILQVILYNNNEILLQFNVYFYIYFITSSPTTLTVLYKNIFLSLHILEHMIIINNYQYYLP